MPTDEPRFALVARQMVDDPAPLIPHLGYDAATRGGEVYSDKPPVFFWLISAFSKLTGGVDETSARLPSFLAAIAAVLLTWRIGALLLDEAAGFAGALILATANQFFLRAAWCSIDMLLTALTLGASFCWLSAARAPRPASRIRLGALGGFLAAAATLSKGPVGLIYPLCFFLTDRAAHLWETGGDRAETAPAESDGGTPPPPSAAASRAAARAPLPIGIQAARSMLRVARLLLARSVAPPVLAAAAAVAVPVGVWIVAIFRFGGRAYASDILVHQNVTRYVAAWNNQAPWHYYIRRLPIGLLPWTILLPAAVLVVKGLPFSLRRSARGLLIGAAAILVFFSISTGKRGVYILPVYFALALLMGLAWLRAESGALRAIARVHIFVLLAAGAFATVAIPIAAHLSPGVLHGFLAASGVDPEAAAETLQRLWMPLFGLAALFTIAALAAGFLFRKDRRDAALLAYAAGIGLLLCLGTLVVVPESNRRAGVASLGAELAAVARPGDVLIVDQEGFEQILFYSRLKGSRRDFDFTRVERDPDGRVVVAPKAVKLGRRAAVPEPPLIGVAEPAAGASGTAGAGSAARDRAATEPEDQRRTTVFSPEIRVIFIVKAERADRIRASLGPGCRTLLAARIYDKPYIVLASRG